MSSKFFLSCAAAWVVAAAAIAISPLSASAQPTVNPGQTIYQRPMAVAERNNLYCAGFVQTGPINTTMQLVGGHEEQEQYVYSENNFVYINAGSGGRLNVGDVLAVVRPRGKVSTKWSNKDNLGFYVQEVGAVEIIRVKQDYYVARVKTSCDNFLLGDLVQPVPARTSPIYRDRPALDRFADSNGKATGRLFMARDNQEMVTRDQIVYVDLGAEDNVQVGDILTVFRPLGKGNLLMPNERETVQNSSYGFESDKYKGEEFSNQAPRRDGEQAKGGSVSQREAKSKRPAGIRKVVGELVILNVKERTATAVVVRTGQEIQTGDWVQIQ